MSAHDLLASLLAHTAPDWRSAANGTHEPLALPTSPTVGRQTATDSECPVLPSDQPLGASPHDASGMTDAAMARLQALLLAAERQRIATLEAQVAALQAILQHGQGLIGLLAPMIGPIIAQRVGDSREEMAEVLYPIIGKSVLRAVNEAIRDLARTLDMTMRRSLRPQFVRRLELRMRGVSPATAALREALPFKVREIFLIHRASGLLIQHLSAANVLPDADLIGGMLTAIRSYVQESFGLEVKGSLDTISYGDLRIMIEEGSIALLAVVAEGIEPAGFQNIVRQQLSALHSACGGSLRSFIGDPVDERATLPFLQPLVEGFHAAT